MRSWGIGIGLLCALWVAAYSAPPALGAAAPEFLFQFSESGGEAGQVQIPRGIATNPTNGNVYVGDQTNKRVDEFGPWGNFIRMFGWKVNKTKVEGGAPEAQQNVCPIDPGDVCQAGTNGNGANAAAGRFASTQGIAVDSTGDVYVLDRPNHRVQKFDPEGHFLLTWGKGVDQGGGTPAHPGNICTAEYLANGDTCGAGEEGAGDGEFGAWTVLGSYIAVGPEDKVWVGDVERIQRFNASGEYQGEITAGIEATEKIQSLAADSAGNLYAAIEGKDGVREWSSSGSYLGETVEVAAPQALATGPANELYVVSGATNPKVRGFDSSHNESFEDVETPEGSTPIEVSTGIATSFTGTLYVANSKQFSSYIRAYGPEPPGEPPSAAPQILAQYASSVSTESATVKAKIDPNFWQTSYYVEYGPSECKAGGCAQTPPPPGVALAGKTFPGIATATLEGLDPDFTYRFRFVAKSEGGGPEYGMRPAGEEEVEGSATPAAGLEGTFRTYREPAPDTGCANQALREGPGARLPDCRGYEMVSPLDKNGGDVDAFVYEGFNALEFYGLDQSASDGGALAYTATAAFGDAAGSPLVSEYIARRGAGGWASEPISPAGEGGVVDGKGFINGEYKAFSQDLSFGWVQPESGKALAPGAAKGFANQYRRDNASGAYAAYCCGRPGGGEPENELLFPELQGFGQDGSWAVFRVDEALNEEAEEAVEGLTSPTWQLYRRDVGGELRLVSVLPDGTPYVGTSSAGTQNKSPDFGADGRENWIEGAASADGTKVYWSTPNDAGTLYLRVNADQPQSAVSGGECTEAARACTLAVSALVPNWDPKTYTARFWGANPNGTQAIFSVAAGGSVSDLYEYRYDEASRKGSVSKIESGGFVGMAGTSKDLSRVYFASTADLDGGGPAVAGKPNLYLSHEGTNSFIATLAEVDVPNFDTAGGPSPVSPWPRDHVARVSPDGRHLAFVSAAKLTGYDNSDAASEEAAREVYLYEAGGELICASCNPSGARPHGADLSQSKVPLWTAAWIPGYQASLYGRRPLSEDGNRLFFNSVDPLALRDVNGAQDVYEWERAGSGDCTSASSTYSPQDKGCVSLISSGQSSREAEFVDASTSGDDVFFRTEASLSPRDPGLVDIYDARVGGGEEAPEAPHVCQGDSCQSIPPAPPWSGPASAALQGPGNPRNSAHRCPKGKRKVKRHGKARCVARHRKRHRRHHKRHHRHAHHRAGAHR
jgi:NHL repeat